MFVFVGKLVAVVFVFSLVPSLSLSLCFLSLCAGTMPQEERVFLLLLDNNELAKESCYLFYFSLDVTCVSFEWGNFIAGLAHDDYHPRFWYIHLSKELHVSRAFCVYIYLQLPGALNFRLHASQG